MVIKDGVVPALESAADVTPAHVRSIQVTGDVGSQRLTRGAGARQGKEAEAAVVAPRLGVQGSAAVANVVVMELSARAEHNGMASTEEMMKRLKAENFSCTWE